MFRVLWSIWEWGFVLSRRHYLICWSNGWNNIFSRYVQLQKRTVTLWKKDLRLLYLMFVLIKSITVLLSSGSNLCYTLIQNIISWLYGFNNFLFLFIYLQVERTWNWEVGHGIWLIAAPIYAWSKEPLSFYCRFRSSWRFKTWGYQIQVRIYFSKIL